MNRIPGIATLITVCNLSACSNGSESASNVATGGHPSDASPDSSGWPDTGGTGGTGGAAGDATTDGQAGAPTDAESDEPHSPPPSGPAVLIDNRIIPEAIDVKLPSIVADDTTVTLAGTTAEQATVWQKLAKADAFGAPQPLGAARGQPDYAATTVTLADGSLHVVWIDQIDPGSLKCRHRPTDGAWGPERQVVSGPEFRPFADVAATSLGLLVVWDQDERLRYSLSTDQGVTWSSPVPTVDAPPGSVPDLTVTSNGAPVLVHAWEKVFCEVWDGTQFLREVLPKPHENDFYADPSLSVGPDGRLWVAARNLEPRLFLAERNLAGTWTVESPFQEVPIGRVTVIADSHGGVHLAWANPAGDPPGLRYAYRPANGAWQPPVVAPIAHFHNGAWMAVSETKPMRVHVVTEDFDDTEGLRLRLVVYDLD